MRKIFFVLFSLVLFTCCTDTDSDDDEVITDNPQTGASRKTGNKKKNAIKLDFFPVPTAIKECSATFTYDTCKKGNGKYVFVSDYEKNNYIKIKGKLIRLSKDTAESKELKDKNYVDVYRGGGYKVVMKVKIVKHDDDVAEYKGTLQVTGNKADGTFKIHGLGRC